MNMRKALAIILSMACTGYPCITGARAQQAMPDTNSSRISPPPQPVPTAPVAGGDDPGKTTDYVVAGWATPGDWRFSMGPTRQAALTVLMLTRQVPGGALGVECHRADGRMEIRMVIDGYAYPGKDKVDARLTVGTGGGPIVLQAEPPPAGKHDASLVILDPVAVTDILYAAAAAGGGAELRVDIDRGRSFGTPLPSDKSITEATARICDGWHKEAQEKH